MLLFGNIKTFNEPVPFLTLCLGDKHWKTNVY